MKANATVAILTYNGQEYLDDLLKSAFSQLTKKEYEVLVIDSGSTDSTLEIVSRYPKVRLHKIPNSEFGHGKTRNLAVQLAAGDFVVFLTQDAVPASKHWLEYMLEPFSVSEQIACVFGKQIARANCFATLKREIFEVFRSFGPDDVISLQRKTTVDGHEIANTFMSDVNSAVRKSIVATKVPFRDVKYAEDQGMGIDVLNKGLIKAYAPLGAVFHSHDYKLGKYFKRKFDESVGLRESTGQYMTVEVRELWLGTVKSSLGDWRFIYRDSDYGFVRKLHDMFWAPFYNLANRLAIRKAASKKLTDKQKAKLSLENQLRSKK